MGFWDLFKRPSLVMPSDVPDVTERDERNERAAPAQDAAQASSTARSLPVIDSRCPHCAFVITPVPQRKRKCPSCKQTILVKYGPTDPQKRLVTEETAAAIEAEWAVVQNHNGLLRQLANYGADENDAERMRRVLCERFGKEPASRDIVWGVSNEKYVAAVQAGDHQTMKRIRFSQALQLFEEKRDHVAMLRESHLHELLQLKKVFGTRRGVKILGGDCDACKKLHGKTMTIDPRSRPCLCRALRAPRS